MGEACRVAQLELAQEALKIKKLRDKLWDGLKDIEEIYLNGHPDKRIPGILNLSINFIEGESLIMGLKNLALSSGSACTSASLEPSYVLRSLGLNDELAHSSLRFSIGRFTTEQEIEMAIQSVRNVISRLREMSPLWDMYQEGIDLNTIEWAAH
jgi:cysteine desulfurase